MCDNSTTCDMMHKCVTWLIHMRHDMTYSYETWLIYVRDDSFMLDVTHLCVTWLIHMRHDSFIWGTTHSYVWWLDHMWHDAFMCDMTHPCVTWRIHMRHDAFIRDTTHSCMTSNDAELQNPIADIRYACDMIQLICNLTHFCVRWCVHVWHRWCWVVEPCCRYQLRMWRD